MTATTHFYITDGHEAAGWNTQGTTHRVDAMRHGAPDGSWHHPSYTMALSEVAGQCAALTTLGQAFKVHDLTAQGKALQRYRDGRAIHVATLKRWKAALRSTAGNPRLVVRVDLGETEVRRDAVEKAVRMARQALAGLRMQTREA